MTARAGWWVVATAFVGISAYSAHSQTLWVKRGSDGKEYHDTAEQIAAGGKMTTESPYAYRIALTWLVGRPVPTQIARGLPVYNVAAAAGGTPPLHGWLA